MSENKEAQSERIVKVRIAYAKWTEMPYSEGDVKEVEIEVPFDTKNGAIKILGVQTEGEKKALTAGEFSQDNIYPSLTHADLDNLTGKLLTYVDATYADAEQRKAHKGIVRDTLWSWFKDRTNNSVDHFKNGGSKFL